MTEQTTTIGKNLESAIDMSNLMLKYIPQDTLFHRNMFLMQKELFFASALNKGSYGFNGFGHNIVLEDLFEVEGAKPTRKKVCVVKSVPMTVGKKVQTATKVARKSVPTAAAGKPSTSKSEQDPDYEPGERGAGESNDDSYTEDVISPLIDQELYIYDCYMVNITDGHYNTKTSIKTCPTKNQCYCSQQFASSDKFKTHEKQYAGQVWACFECDKKSKGSDKHTVYKHYRTQHERRHMHQCTFDTCSVDGHPFGNGEQHMVSWHV